MAAPAAPKLGQSRHGGLWVLGVSGLRVYRVYRAYRVYRVYRVYRFKGFIGFMGFIGFRVSGLGFWVGGGSLHTPEGPMGSFRREPLKGSFERGAFKRVLQEFRRVPLRDTLYSIYIYI